MTISMKNLKKEFVPFFIDKETENKTSPVCLANSYTYLPQESDFESCKVLITYIDRVTDFDKLPQKFSVI